MDRIVYLVTEDWYFLSHRLPAARTARDMGLQVHVVTRSNGNTEQFDREGFVLHPISVNRTGTSISDDLALIRQLSSLFRQIKPRLVHNVALKPIVYGSQAAKMASNPPVINAFAGLGFVYSSSSTKARVLRPFVSTALRHANAEPTTTALFQNKDDLARLVTSRVIRENQAFMIPGSGVDVERFNAQPTSRREQDVVVGLPARLLIEKGVLDFVQAARELRKRRPHIRMALVGQPDPVNPSSVSPRQIEEWEKLGLVEYWGWSENMAQTLRNIDIICLPSYREGLPKSLIEASSAGLPVITTDVPGCRDAIIPGVTGIRIPPKSPTDLAQAIQILADSSQLRQSMGQAGRQFAVRNFSNERVTTQLRHLYSAVLDGG